jgi:AraC family transcriptional activator of pyochelin receptor
MKGIFASGKLCGPLFQSIFAKQLTLHQFMPLLVTNTADNNVVHQNSYVAEDFNSAQLVEASREIHLPFGDGQLAHWYFEGIRMAYSLWKYKSVQTIEWNSQLDVITLYFSLKGKVTLELKEQDKCYTFSSGQHNMLYAGNFNGQFTNHELVQETFILQFTKQAFATLALDCGELIQDFLRKINHVQSLLITDENLYMDVAMHHAIRQILDCQYDGGLKKIFLRAKCLEIVAAQLGMLERAQNKAPVYCKTEYDRERILFARDYLVQHLDMPPSLAELARIAGINEFKLKHGFKEMFNTTVFGYLAEQRLELAKHDILEGKKTASEIAFELGYASPQHFSTAFKKKFGVSPKNHK